MKKIKINSKIKKYNMYTKRYSSFFVRKIKGNQLSLSKVRNGGISAYALKGDVK